MENNFQSGNESEEMLYCQYNFDFDNRDSFANLDEFLTRLGINDNFARKSITIIRLIWCLKRFIVEDKNKMPHCFIYKNSNNYYVRFHFEVYKDVFNYLANEVDYVNAMTIEAIKNYYKSIPIGRDFLIYDQNIQEYLIHLKSKSKENITIGHKQIMDSGMNMYINVNLG